ncbi:hypothetical protein XA68_13141 [Ophiocordyceps unilateralis]|uniref:Uncharacterized protein n=1 Tax=Ophiocordyceps unilateralis TaxID=268505 RepID=A0A2A9PMH2_OPHUN|nr:hypothetical protein XA68_13141 [Ophiocordyceps unilateralis]
MQTWRERMGSRARTRTQSQIEPGSGTGRIREVMCSSDTVRDQDKARLGTWPLYERVKRMNKGVAMEILTPSRIMARVRAAIR